MLATSRIEGSFIDILWNTWPSQFSFIIGKWQCWLKSKTGGVLESCLWPPASSFNTTKFVLATRRRLFTCRRKQKISYLLRKTDTDKNTLLQNLSGYFNTDLLIRCSHNFQQCPGLMEIFACSHEQPWVVRGLFFPLCTYLIFHSPGHVTKFTILHGRRSMEVGKWQESMFIAHFFTIKLRFGNTDFACALKCYGGLTKE